MPLQKFVNLDDDPDWPVFTTDIAGEPLPPIRIARATAEQRALKRHFDAHMRGTAADAAEAAAVAQQMGEPPAGASAVPTSNTLPSSRRKRHVASQDDRRIAVDSWAAHFRSAREALERSKAGADPDVPSGEVDLVDAWAEALNKARSGGAR